MSQSQKKIIIIAASPIVLSLVAVAAALNIELDEDYLVNLGRSCFLLICATSAICQFFPRKTKNFWTRIVAATDNLKHSQPNLYFLSVFRVLYGFLVVTVAIRAIQNFDVLFWDIENPWVRKSLKITFVVYACGGFATLLGAGGRIVRALLFVLGAVLVRNFYTFGIFEATVCFNGLFAALTPCDKKLALRAQASCAACNGLIRPIDSCLPVYIVGIHFGFVLLYCGIDKLLDPMWLRGLGFFSVVANLNYMLPSCLDQISHTKPVMLVANYAGLIIEIAFLPLFLWAKTRAVSLIGLVLLALGLCWPLNIFLIGPLALAFAIGMLSIIPSVTLRHTKSSSQSPCLLNYFVFISYSATFFIPSMITSFWGDAASVPTVNARLNSKYYKSWKKGIEGDLPASSPEKMNFWEEVMDDLNFEDLLKCRRLLQNYGRWFLGGTRYALFSKRHSLGMRGYRVKLLLEDGRTIEPVKFFNENLERPPLWDGILELNCYQGAMYTFSDIAAYAAHGVYLEKNVRKALAVLILPFIDKSISQMDEDLNVLGATLLVARMGAMTEFPPVKNFTKEIYWEPLLQVDLATRRYVLEARPTPQPIQGRRKELPNYLPFSHEVVR